MQTEEFSNDEQLGHATKSGCSKSSMEGFELNSMLIDLVYKKTSIAGGDLSVEHVPRRRTRTVLPFKRSYEEVLLRF